MGLYHFSLGDSSKGPIGYCARIQAASPEAAAARLADIVRDYENGLEVFIDGPEDGEYVEVYFRPDAVTVRAIDDEEDEMSEKDHETAGEDNLDTLYDALEATGVIGPKKADPQ